MKLYSPTYLQRHGDDYVANRISKHGVTLQQYLADPDRYAHLALAHEPLLDRQRAVQEALDAEQSVEDLPRCNGAPIEKLRSRCQRGPRLGRAQFKGGPVHE